MKKESETVDQDKFERRLAKEKAYWKRWEAKRQHKFQYAARYAVLNGILLGTILMVFDWHPEANYFLMKIIFRFVLFIILGYFIGLMEFNKREKKYQRYLLQKEE